MNDAFGGLQFLVVEFGPGGEEVKVTGGEQSVRDAVVGEFAESGEHLGVIVCSEEIRKIYCSNLIQVLI